MSDLQRVYDLIHDEIFIRPDSSQAPYLHQLLRGLLDEAKRSKDTENWIRNERYFDSDFFDIPAQVAREVNFAYFNELKNHVRHYAAWLTDRVPKIQVFPAGLLPKKGEERIPPPPSMDKVEIEAQAKLMQRLLQGRWVADHWSSVAYEFLMDVLVYGVGFIEVVWDPYLDDGAGNVRLRRINPWFVWVDPLAEDSSSICWLVIREELYEAELRRHYPDYDASLDRATSEPASRAPEFSGSGRGIRGTTESMTTSSVSEGSYGPSADATGTEKATKAGVSVYTLYLSCDEQDVDFVRKVWYRFRFTDHVFLGMESVDQFPVGVVRFCRKHKSRFWGESLVDMLAEPQRNAVLLSTLLTQDVHITADPIWIEEAGARGIEKPERKRPGDRIVVRDGYYGRVGYIDPPRLQPEAFRLLDLFLGFQAKVSGLSGPMREAQVQPNTRVGAQQMAAEATQVLMRETSRRYQEEIEKVLTSAANICARSLKASRRVPLVDDESVLQYVDLPDFAFDGSGFVVHFEAGTSMAVNQQLRSSNALRYYMATGGRPGPLWLARQLGIEGAAEMIKQSEEVIEAQLKPSRDALQASIGKLAEATGALRNVTEEVKTT